MGKLTKAAIGILCIVIATKLLGFIKEMLMAYCFGTSEIVDAYTIAISFPSVVFALFMSGVSNSFIPIYSRIKEDGEKKSFVDITITMMFIISLLIMIPSILLSDKLVSILAPGFGTGTEQLASQLLMVILFVLPIMTIINVLIPYLNNQERFLFASFCYNIITDIILILSIYVSYGINNTMMLAYGFVISQTIPLILISIYTHTLGGYKYNLSFKYKNENFKNIIKLAIPFGASMLTNQINTMIDRLLASLLGAGIIAALNYANKVQLIFYSLTTMVFMSVCYPRINYHFANKEDDKAIFYVNRGIMIASVMGIPVALCLIIFSEPFTKLLFERGMFENESTIITAKCLAFYSIGIPFYSYREIFSRVLASQKKQSWILKNTVIAVGCNIVCSVVLMNICGYIGIAVATSLAGIIASILMYLDVRKFGYKIIKSNGRRDLLKIFICSISTVLICEVIYNCATIEIGELYISLIMIIVAIVAYILLCYILKIEIFMWTLKTITKGKGEKK